MKRKTIISLLLIFISLTGCQKAESKGDEGEVDFLLTTVMSIPSPGYNKKAKYSDSYFKKSATVFNADLMRLSYASSMISHQPEEAIPFFDTMKYDSYYFGPDYDVDTNDDTIGYTIAHKRIDNFDLVAIPIRSYDYGKEWSNNFDVGKEGNHAGFEKSSTKVFTALKEYLDAHKDFKNLKIWTSGYSRGGAVANFLSHLILKNKIVNKKNLFTYTFEAPTVLTKENAIAYENVFNMVNPGDFVARIPPAEYGLYRCGVDKTLYDERVGEFLKELDDTLELEEFKPDEANYKNDKEYCDYFVATLLAKSGDEEYEAKYPYAAYDREHYFQIQDYIRYLLVEFLSVPNYLFVLPKKFESIGMIKIISALSGNGDALYKIISEIFDEYKVSYDSDYLRECCSVMVLFAKRYLASLTALALNSNSIRMIKMHLPETVYVLLDKYNAK